MSVVDTKEFEYLNLVPEAGQLVEVRRRQWVVSEVMGSTMGTDEQMQHLVTLSSLDEDALGEELQIVWQIEPGARVLEKAGLPRITGWDDHDRLEAFLDAVRWGAITNADRSFLQAPFRSGIAIEDYQLDPLVRAVEMARVNLLIADDVGLGKTIEAGLVIQEMLVRHRARSVLIVCPASLQVKWQTEMWEKFGLEFRIVDTDYIKTLRRERGIHANPWTSFPRLITSMDWVKSGEGMRRFKDILPDRVTYPRKFDILVVDEAHNVAPSSSTHYALESQRTRMIRTIAPHFEHRLFLTATPHNGYQESFTSLLELLDDQRFARGVMPDEKQLQRVMVRRLKRDIVDAQGNSVYPARRLEALELDYTDEEHRIHKLLDEFTKSRSVTVKGTRFEYGTEFVHKLLKKRLFSSPAAFAMTIQKHRETIENKRERKTDDRFEEKILRTAILRAEEEYADDSAAEEAQSEAMQAVIGVEAPLAANERSILSELTSWAEIEKNRVDSKAKAILEWLGEYLKPSGSWNESRVILFTEYRATHAWLERILSTHGYGGDRLMMLHGGILPDDREKIKAAFQANPSVSKVRILLATDAASEGIDLQNHCNYMIHVEIPWNPNVLEQRNGRIDRHGQKHDEVVIWHPVGKSSSGSIEGDHEFLMRAVRKIDRIREDLGSVGPVIAAQIEEAMLGKRVDLDTRVAESKAEGARKFVVSERKLKERVQKLHEKLMEAREDFHLSADHIARAVAVGMELAEKPPLRSIGDALYEVPALAGSWGRAAVGLEHPHTGVRRPITFDHEKAKGRDDVVLAHLNHRLVQMSLRLLREELWKLDDVKKLHRVAVKVVDEPLEHPVVIALSRLVVMGGNHHRLHEEITLSGGELKPSGFIRIPQQGRLQTLLDSSQACNPSEKLFDILKERFGNAEDATMKTVEARSNDRLKYLETTLMRRKESEKADLLQVLEELERNIARELREENMPQQLLLPGFEEDERNQLRRDIEALRRRLERIPSEKEQEIGAIERRYEGIADRTFPVAVLFVVSRAMVEKDYR